MTQLDQKHPNNSFQDDAIHLKELVDLLWGGKILIILITSVFALGSIYYAFSQPDVYKSQAILSISESGGGAALNTTGGLASIVGIRISGSGFKGPLAINTIRSRVFLKHLLSVDENILPSIKAAARYDSESKKLVFDSDVYDATNKKWLRAQPSYLQTYGAYMGLINIKFHEVRRTIDISVEHISPIFAKEFLELIIRECDNLLRQKDLQRSSEALAYLTSEISRTPLLDIKSSINQLILSQLQTQMLAKMSSNYVLDVIEPPFTPLNKFKPSRSFICMAGAMIGFVVGILWIMIRYYFALNKIKQT